MTAVSIAAACDNLTIHNQGATVSIVLNRPDKHNAICGSMRAGIAAAIPKAARDPNIYAVVIRSAVPGMFSVGSDLAELCPAAREQPDEARKILAEEYALNWLLECYSKPTVSLIDGSVAGGGAGLTAYGTHRVVGESYELAMPSTAVGLVPDEGLAWVFARLPGQVGLYLGLTGRRIGRADAFRYGLATHCIPAERFGEIERGLREADPVDPLLDDLHEDPGPGEIEAYRDTLEHCFAAASVEEIFARLAERARRAGAAGAWCAGVLEDLSQRSPTALKLAYRHIREAAVRDLRQTLTVDYRLACRLVQAHDFREGVRASLAGGNARPRWAPASVAEVTDAMVDRFFAFEPGRELNLPTRQEMQAARV